MTVHQTPFDRQAHHYAAVKARLRGEPKRVMIRVDMRHAAPIKPVRLKSSTRDQQNEFIKHRCQQLRVCCKTITTEPLSPRVKTIRDQILMGVKARWPNAQARRLGELFNRKANSIRGLPAPFQIASPADYAGGGRNNAPASVGRNELLEDCRGRGHHTQRGPIPSAMGRC